MTTSTKDLEGQHRELRAQARKLTASINEGTSEKEARAIEAKFNAVMLDVADVEDQIAEARAREADIDTRKRPQMRDGSTDEDMPEVEMDHLEPSQRMRDWGRKHLPASEYEKLGAGRYLRSLILGGQTDLEKRALAEGTDSAGGYTAPSPVATELIDLLRANSVAMAAGARTVPLTSDSNTIAKLASDPVPAWRAENAAIAESDPTFTRVLMEPKSLAVQVKVSRELMEDSVNIATELPRILAAALAKEWDRVALMGSGSGSEPTGIENTVGIGTNALSGALSSYAPLVTARTAIKTANAEPTAYIMHPRDEGTLAGLTASDGQPLMAPRQVSDIPWLTTTSIPIDGGAGTNESTLFCGDFRHLYLGVRTEIRVEIMRELYATNWQYGLFCVMRGDIGIAHPAAFHSTTAITA